MGAGDLSYGDLSQILRTLAHTIDSKGEQLRGHSLERRRLTTVQRLLAGERLDASLLNYNLDGSHAGFVIADLEPDYPFRDLRHSLKSRLLLVRADSNTVWGWLGGKQQALQGDLRLLRAQKWPDRTAVACGEPADALGGWRLTHRQALAALPCAQTAPPDIYYRDVALLATALQDDLLSSSLRRSYLDPLKEERDGGLAAKDTLRAYFKAERNASSAAALLGVNRATVRNRLTAIEERLDRSLDAISAELELALKLDAFGLPHSRRI